MAVVVTKRGITKAEKNYTGSCFNCKTEIKCLGSDLLVYRCDSHDPREHDYEYVKCPVCGNQITNVKEAIVASPLYDQYYDR